jgi:hypothetical protein
VCAAAAAVHFKINVGSMTKFHLVVAIRTTLVEGASVQFMYVSCGKEFIISLNNWGLDGYMLLLRVGSKNT